MYGSGHRIGIVHMRNVTGHFNKILIVKKFCGADLVCVMYHTVTVIGYLQEATLHLTMLYFMWVFGESWTCEIKFIKEVRKPCVDPTKKSCYR